MCVFGCIIVCVGAWWVGLCVCLESSLFSACLCERESGLDLCACVCVCVYVNERMCVNEGTNV